MRGSSGMTGSFAAREPAAMMQFSKVISRSPTASDDRAREPRLAVDHLDLALLGEPAEARR